MARIVLRACTASVVPVLAFAAPGIARAAGAERSFVPYLYELAR